MEQLRATDAWQATKYDTWNPEGGDWGWMSSSTDEGNLELATRILQQLGFIMGKTAWGLHRFDAMEEFAPPSEDTVQAVCSP